MKFRAQGSTTTLSHGGFSDYSIWALNKSTSVSIYDSLKAMELLTSEAKDCGHLYGAVWVSGSHGRPDIIHAVKHYEAFNKLGPRLPYIPKATTPDLVFISPISASLLLLTERRPRVS